MNRKFILKRFLEIIPGGISWGLIITLVFLAIFKPVACAVFIIIFDFYWIIRTVPDPAFGPGASSVIPAEE